MDTTYIEYHFTITPKQPATEILIAELGVAGFESFVENEQGVQAYIQQKDWNEHILNDIYILQSGEFAISYKKKVIEQINWNSEWEKNFQPIEVEGKVSVRAPFHPKTNLPYEIIIEPKMSFGTGHHETTYAMLQQLLTLEVKNKSVLDMGCGTGILAIFAEMKGATPIDAIDIDPWCYENSLENVNRNGCTQILVYEGDASLLTHKKYDIIIANINRNILLNDMKTYVQSLASKGILLLSGFYKKDIPIMDAEAEKYQLKKEVVIEKNNWVSVKYRKK